MGGATVAAPARLRGPYVKPPKPPAGAEALTCSTPRGAEKRLSQSSEFHLKLLTGRSAVPSIAFQQAEETTRLNPKSTAKEDPNLLPQQEADKVRAAGLGFTTRRRGRSTSYNREPQYHLATPSTAF